MKKFIAPEYYPEFLCKTSRCRRPCCEGWKITVSLEDYFRLIGADCPVDIRRSLDCALKIDGTDRERYARLSADYTGRCRLHRGDGLCRIQAELGEAYLPALCRSYPRAVRLAYLGRCCCSASCEAVAEALYYIKIPMKFVSADPPPDRLPDDRRFDADDLEISERCADLMQDASRSLPERFASLGDFLGVRSASGTPAAPDLEKAVGVMLRFAASIGGSGANACTANADTTAGGYCRKALGNLSPLREEASQGAAAKKYAAMTAAFGDIYPEWPAFFENLLVNQMFYDTFPYPVPGLRGARALRAAYIGLAAVYALLRFIAVACLAPEAEAEAEKKGSGRVEALIDLVSGMFRLIAHSELCPSAPTLLKKLGCADENGIFNLLYL